MSETFAEFIRAWRLRMGYTQKEASIQLCSNFHTVRGWESNRSPANPEAIKRLARYIEGVQPPELNKRVRAKPKPSSAILDWSEGP